MKKLTIKTRRQKRGKATKETSNEIQCTVLRRHNKRVENGLTGKASYAKSVTLLISPKDYNSLIRPHKRKSVRLIFEETEFQLFRMKDTQELDGISSGIVLSAIERTTTAADFLRRPITSKLYMEIENDTN